MLLCLESDQLDKVKRILKIHFAGFSVYAYGPRVSGINLTPDIELNIAVVSEKPISLEKMVAVEKAFSESGLPFQVDIVDWAKLPESMEKKIKKEHIVIQDSDKDL